MRSTSASNCVSFAPTHLTAFLPKVCTSQSCLRTVHVLLAWCLLSHRRASGAENLAPTSESYNFSQSACNLSSTHIPIASLSDGYQHCDTITVACARFLLTRLSNNSATRVRWLWYVFALLFHFILHLHDESQSQLN